MRTSSEMVKYPLIVREVEIVPRMQARRDAVPWRPVQSRGLVVAGRQTVACLAECREQWIHHYTPKGSAALTGLHVDTWI